MRRDLIRYGASPPNSDLSNQARLAVNFALNSKDGAGPSISDGDAASRWMLSARFSKRC